ncbi:MAG TPA: glycosyltransferase [Bryobacteraceae bacterium]|nr:glycosyltransferase [Bryobacteraceae bacterium]
MKIALYYPWVYLPGGPERTITEVLALSRHQWHVFTNRYEPEATFPSLRNADITEFDRVSVKRSFFPVAQAAWRIARQKVPLEGYDALVVFCEGLGDFLIFRNTSIPLICLCFTPLRAAFDGPYQERYLSANRGRFWRKPILAAGSAFYRAIDRWLWRKYHAVFAISREVRRRIVAGNLYPEEKIDLLYPGVDTRRLAPTGASSLNFLVPGRIMWTKNLELAIDAFRLLHERRPDFSGFTLTIAGHVDRKSEKYYEMLQARAAGCPQILFRTALSDENLFQLLDSAYALVYPPFNEDWGLIPLEGMSFEKPVIAVNRGGPSETVVDGESGLLVDPEPEKFAAAMEMFAGNPDLVRRMGKKARVRALEFDWTCFCGRLDDALDRLLVSRERPAAATALDGRPAVGNR